MLLSFYQLNITQDEIVQAAGISETIVRDYGARIDQLAQGINALFPAGEYRLMAKYDASVDDLAWLTGELSIPAGIEWQGQFRNPDGTYRDQGHYTVVTGVNWERRILKTVDPEDKSILTAGGELALDVFEPRWWEVDHLPVPGNPQHSECVRNERLIFVIARQLDVQRLQARGFESASLVLMWKYRVPQLVY
jgi:hypothetical protein